MPILGLSLENGRIFSQSPVPVPVVDLSSSKSKQLQAAAESASSAYSSKETPAVTTKSSKTKKSKSGEASEIILNSLETTEPSSSATTTTTILTNAITKTAEPSSYSMSNNTTTKSTKPSSAASSPNPSSITPSISTPLAMGISSKFASLIVDSLGHPDDDNVPLASVINDNVPLASFIDHDSASVSNGSGVTSAGKTGSSGKGGVEPVIAGGDDDADDHNDDEEDEEDFYSGQDNIDEDDDVIEDDDGDLDGEEEDDDDDDNEDDESDEDDVEKSDKHKDQGNVEEPARGHKQQSLVPLVNMTSKPKENPSVQEQAAPRGFSLPGPRGLPPRNMKKPLPSTTEQKPNGTSGNKSGIFSSIAGAINSFIDPDLTEEELLGPEPEDPFDFPTAILQPSDSSLSTTAKPGAYNPDDDFFEGKKLFDQRQWEKARFHFETAAMQCDHIASMWYLVEIFHPSRLSNASKVSEWTKRRMTLLSTGAGMLSYGMFLLRNYSPSSTSSTSSSKKSLSAAAAKEASKNVAEAIVMIRTAADLGHAPAMYEFANYLRMQRGKGSEAMAWFHKAAEAGFMAAEVFLAQGYETGTMGVPADPIAGAHWRARVSVREKEAEEIAKVEKEKLALEARRAREEAAWRLRERMRAEDTMQKREEELKERRMIDPELNKALRSIEWGFISSGIEQLHKLAVEKGSADARDFLNPDISAISAKNTQAMFYLGQHHAIHADFAGAVKWYRRAAEAGYHEAMVTLAAYLLVGKGIERPDPGLAMIWLIKAWDAAKNKEAALALGEAYTKGIGLMPDPNKAVKWYIKAWESGEYPEAAFAVGLAYATGYTPGAVDPSEWSASTYAPSNQSGMNDMVKKHLESKGHKDPVSSLGGSDTAINNGVLASLTAVGAAKIQNDDDGVPTSVRNISVLPPSSGTALTASSAASSSPASSLPTSLNNSTGTTPISSPIASRKVLKGMTAVKQDLPSAVHWYKKAANLGHIRSCNNLGELYMTGRGVAGNDTIGYGWFKKAAMGGLAEAEYNVGRCLKDGRGCEKDEVEALVWFRKAEAQGIKEATMAISQISP